MQESIPKFSLDHDACGVGFIAQVNGKASHEIVQRALTALARLAHRGGTDADGRSGDGAGLLAAIPSDMIRNSAAAIGIPLPKNFGLGMTFLPPQQERACRLAVEAAAETFGLKCLGWREVPTDCSVLGQRSLESVPQIRQCFFAAQTSSSELEMLLFRLRKSLQTTIPHLYFCSLSSRTVVYKGLLTPEQLPAFYRDLADPQFASAFTIFHQRYSTNTQPSWTLAQPFRFIAHNGEINTINCNRRWLQARHSSYLDQLGVPESCPLLESGLSDSGSFDNSFEICLRLGHSLPEAISRLVPPAWENDRQMDAALRHWFQRNMQEQEPWDGPAALVFSDGRMVGAKLDRNGLRPLRYTLTSDGLLVVGSEVGIADLQGTEVIERQRLGPGEMLLVDTTAGAFFRPTEVLKDLQRKARKLASPPVSMIEAEPVASAVPEQANRFLAAMGWTEDLYRILFLPLVQGEEALWSMGDDAPPASLSALRPPLWNYCKQRFAQVTNPPIDPLRESQVMSLQVYLSERVMLSSPLVDTGQLQRIKGTLTRVCQIDFTFDARNGVRDAHATLERVREQAQQAIERKAELVVLSDRAISKDRAALPALLAVAAVWKSMTTAGGWKIPLVIETGQVADTHHFALLVAAGAAAVHPFLALEMAESTISGGAARYRAAVEKGLCKVLARMGICNITSYRNSLLFETAGLDREVCTEFFDETVYTFGGTGLETLLQDCLIFHKAGFGGSAPEFRDRGLYRFRQNGERHANSPEFVRRLQRYIKFPSPENHDSWALLATERMPVAVRDMFEIARHNAIPVKEVESEASLLSRFSTQAMSLGAISPEAHRTLATAMNQLGARSNTGEGGEDWRIYSDMPEANNRVKQVASGRFGVTTEYLVRADEIEIKMAQGSKPGEGGQLPANKVTPYIARLRHAVPGTTLISPPPHHDVYSIEDLAQLIYDLRSVNPYARIGVKLVSTSGVGIIAAGVAKAGADVITISGHDGGTGASPLTSIKNTGLPWEIGLREAHTVLLRAGLRARVRLRVDGGLKFARDVVIAALLGAEEFGFGTAALLAIGCVMARQCHLNTCPVGIATQNEQLRARFTGNPSMVQTYFRALASDVRELLTGMGAHSIDEIVGQSDRLQPHFEHGRQALDCLHKPINSASAQFAGTHNDDSELRQAINRAIEEFESLASHSHRFRISNSDRAIGAHFSGEILRRTGFAGLSAGTLDFEFVGTAGQSFGAFLIEGVSFRLIGEANDYVGKGLCGGIIAVNAGAEASRRSDVLVGNTCLYGATAGELYIAGQAGERFAVRNSGALSVVEGVGQHGCEYMTGGIVLVLGPVGANFGAGMTGGLAYAMPDAVGDRFHCSVRRVTLGYEEERWLRRILRRHVQLTGSPRAARLLTSAALPFHRLEPVAPPCTPEETWAPMLTRIGPEDLRTFERHDISASDGPAVI